jgi:hypothetical protein
MKHQVVQPLKYFRSQIISGCFQVGLKQGAKRCETYAFEAVLHGAEHAQCFRCKKIGWVEE